MPWILGQKAELARQCSVSAQYLGDILAKRKRALPELAAKIETAAKAMGLEISRIDVMYPEETENPLLGAHVSGKR